MSFWPQHMSMRLVPLKYACVLNPDTLPETTDPDFEMEYVDIGSVSLEKGIESREPLRFGQSPSRARKPIRNGDVIIATVRTYLKAIALVEGASSNWVASTGFAVCRPAKGVIPEYLYRVMQSNSFVESVVASSTGVSYPAINPSTLGKLPIPLPDLPTQQAIADFLDRETARIDQLVEKKERIIGLLKEKRSSLIARAVTKGLDPNALMRSSGIEWLGNIPAHWDVTRLKWVGEAITGLTYSPDDIVDSDRGTLVLRSSNIQNSRIDLADTVYVSYAIPERLRTRPGDILICSRNGSRELIGKNAIIGEHLRCATFGAFMTVFRSDRNCYIYHVLNSPIFTFQAGVFLTTTINQLTLSTLNNLEIPLPPRDEGEAISRYIEAKTSIIDSLVTKEELSNFRLRELRSALITAAVTGQIDVATWGKRRETDQRLEAIEHELEAEREEVAV